MKKLTLVGAAFVVAMTSFSSQAERIRYCNGEFWAEPLGASNNLVGSRVGFSGFRGEGRHGGIQANTARERAREKIRDCFNGPFTRDKDFIPSCDKVDTLWFSFNDLIQATYDVSNRKSEIVKYRVGWKSTGDNRCGGSSSIVHDEL